MSKFLGRSLKLVVLSVLLVGLVSQSAFAAPATNPSKEAVATAKRIAKEIKKLRRLMVKTGVRQRMAAYSASQTDFDDSDGDGMLDFIEDAEGSNSCSADSDNDGIEDGDESESGSDPEDGSNGEVELKGNITAITATTVEVGGYVFTVSATTEFEGGTSLASFSVGNYVEVEGKIVSGVMTLKHIKLED